ncbi:MAG: undecaprenyl-diphosphate phosphatase [Bacillota bacterium]|nr:undecaprenyl-diphosphate phosphatase [Bacillota bacterium]
MQIWEAALLGLIQGLTEFLPVSSSGHLVLFQELLGLKEPGVTLEVILHFGTLLSVFWVFRHDFLNLLKFRQDKSQAKLMLLLIIGIIPTGLIGLIINRYTDILFQSILLVGIMLIVTGIILKILTFLPAGRNSVKGMQFKDALWIGIFQGFAVIPGISRSGSTIMAAIWRGLDRDTAVRYSFMLAAPAILGATLLEMRELLVTGIESVQILHYSIGGLISFLSGVAAIKIFINLLARHKFQYFAYYCWIIGLIVITVAMFGRN